MCHAPCGSNWYLTISRTNLYNQVGVETNTVLQGLFSSYYYYYYYSYTKELLPPASSDVRDFNTFTAYDETSRQFAVVAADFPRETQATFWVSYNKNNIKFHYSKFKFELMKFE